VSVVDTAVNPVGADVTARPALTVTIFTKNRCSICDSTKRQFDLKGVPYHAINVEEVTEPLAELNGMTPLDYVVTNFGRQMPVVVVEDDLGWRDWWSGGRMDKWMETIARFDEAGLLIPEHERAA